jgi:hypothetical protein
MPQSTKANKERSMRERHVHGKRMHETNMREVLWFGGKHACIYFTTKSKHQKTPCVARQAGITCGGAGRHAVHTSLEPIVWATSQKAQSIQQGVRLARGPSSIEAVELVVQEVHALVP